MKYVILIKARTRGAKDIKKRKKKFAKDYAARMLGYNPEKGPQSLKDVFKARTVGAKDKKLRKKKLSKKRIDKLKEIERKAQLTFPFIEKLGIGR